MFTLRISVISGFPNCPLYPGMASWRLLPHARQRLPADVAGVQLFLEPSNGLIDRPFVGRRSDSSTGQCPLPGFAVSTKAVPRVSGRIQQYGPTFATSAVGVNHQVQD